MARKEIEHTARQLIRGVQLRDGIEYRTGFGNDDHAIFTIATAKKKNAEIAETIAAFRDKIEHGEISEKEAKKTLKWLKEIPIKPIVMAGVILDNPTETDEKRYTVSANSDGDVIYHAVMNAILLASGKRDMGYNFPDTGTSKWTDADSAKMMAMVTEQIKQEGWVVINATCMVTAGAPILKPHIPKMRANLASALGIDLQSDQSQIGIGATTGEGLSRVARKEGIHSDASVLLARLVRA